MQPTAETITERDTVNADGYYNLSAIMRIATRKAQIDARTRAKAGLKKNYRSDFRDALRNVWNFAQIYRHTVLAEAAYRAARAPAPVVLQEAA